MGNCQDRNGDLTQHSLGQRTEQKSFYGIPTAGAHDEEVNLFVMDNPQQLTSNVAHFDHGLQVQTLLGPRWAGQRVQEANDLVYLSVFSNVFARTSEVSGASN